MSISWGKSERFRFTAVGSLLSWNPPSMPAIYAITYRQDVRKPKVHTVLFFGQADDLSLRARHSTGEIVHAWRNSNHNANDLWVFIHPMPGSTTGERFKIQEQLVSEYEPQCNR